MGPGLKAKIISIQKNLTTIEVEIAKYLLENL